MLNKGASLIIEKLNSFGYSAYIVGGSVRNALLNLEVSDYDVTTDALPNEIISCFSEYKLITTGIKHGTVGVLVENEVYEITTFRLDGEYNDCRHPSSVSFTNKLSEDLSRRDFTINALAYSPKSGIVDEFNGISDLNNGIIRTVGNADLRFKEDALRILRAVRFSSTLGFKIEPETQKAMFENVELLKNISAERIYSELTKIICGKNVRNAISLNYPVIFEIIPQFKACYGLNQKSLSHSEDVFEHTLHVVSNCGQNNLVLRLTALFHDMGKPFSFQDDNEGFRHFVGHWVESSKIAESVLTQLKAPKKVISEVSAMCLHHDEPFNSKYDIKKLLNERGIEFFEMLLEHKFCDISAHTPHGIAKYKPSYDLTEKLFNEIVAKGECYSLSMLDYCGDDAKKQGFCGEQIKRVENTLLDLVMQDKLENKKEVLIDYANHNLR